MKKTYLVPDTNSIKSIKESFTGLAIGKNDIKGREIKVGSLISFKSDNYTSSNEGVVVYNVDLCSFVISINTENFKNGYVKIDKDLYDVEIIIP